MRQPLIMYEVFVSEVKKFERIINKAAKMPEAWLGACTMAWGATMSKYCSIV